MDTINAIYIGKEVKVTVRLKTVVLLLFNYCFFVPFPGHTHLFFSTNVKIHIDSGDDTYNTDQKPNLNYVSLSHQPPLLTIYQLISMDLQQKVHSLLAVC